MAKTTTSKSRRMKCACASCQCTVNPDKALRKGNLVFCCKACAERKCTIEECRCECDCCAS